MGVWVYHLTNKSRVIKQGDTKLKVWMMRYGFLMQDYYRAQDYRDDPKSCFISQWAKSIYRGINTKVDNAYKRMKVLERESEETGDPVYVIFSSDGKWNNERIFKLTRFDALWFDTDRHPGEEVGYFSKDKGMQNIGLRFLNKNVCDLDWKITGLINDKDFLVPRDESATRENLDVYLGPRKFNGLKAIRIIDEVFTVKELLA